MVLIDADMHSLLSIQHIEGQNLEVIVLQRDPTSSHLHVHTQALLGFMAGSEERFKDRRLRLELHGLVLEGSTERLDWFFDWIEIKPEVEALSP